MVRPATILPGNSDTKDPGRIWISNTVKIMMIKTGLFETVSPAGSRASGRRRSPLRTYPHPWKGPAVVRGYLAPDILPIDMSACSLTQWPREGPSVSSCIDLTLDITIASSWVMEGLASLPADERSVRSVGRAGIRV